MNIVTQSIYIGDPAAADTMLVLQAPSDDIGGGIRILEAMAVNMAATAGGTSFTLALHKYSSAGTPAVNGTITDTLGGSADEWADSVPKEFTIDSDYSFLDADEWLGIAYAEENSGNPTRCYVTVKYAVGK